MRSSKNGSAHYSAFRIPHSTFRIPHSALLPRHAHLPLQHLAAVHLKIINIQPFGQITRVEGDLALAVREVEAAQGAASEVVHRDDRSIGS